MTTNTALVFLKPHVAANEQAFDQVKGILTNAGVTIVEEKGVLSGSDIAKSAACDLHYADICQKAKKVHPSTLGTDDKFEGKFNAKWQEKFGAEFNWKDLVNGRIAGHIVHNVGAYLQAAGIPEEQAIEAFLPKWQAAADDGKLSKLAGGFYVVLVDEADGANVWCVNGFWYDMKREYVEPADAPRANVMVVEFDPAVLTWEKFRDDVLGTTEPKDSPATSIRGVFYANREAATDAGLQKIDKGSNVCHASASPYEALRERLIWGAGKETIASADDFVYNYASDAFAGAAWLEAGISAELLNALDSNPNITNKVYLEAAGVSGDSPAYDVFECKDTDDVRDILVKWQAAFASNEPFA